MRKKIDTIIKETATASGMTLLEVVAVLVLLGIMALTAASRMNTGTLDLTTTTEGITSRLRLVQTIAMNSSPGVRGLRFETGSQTYYMFHCDDPNSCDMTAHMEPLQGADTAPDGRMAVSDGKVQLLTDGNVAYDGFGKPYQIAGSHAVALTTPLVLSFSDLAGNTGTIRITPKTGFIP